MMDLTGKLLIAMPTMGDPRFAHSVVFLCSHTHEGAMGLIINKPTEELRLSTVMEQLDIVPQSTASEMPVHFGGPVETGRGFVLHSSDYVSNLQSLSVTDQISLTETLDVLEDLAVGTGPEQALLMLGYAGWGAGQLEAEIGLNGWLTAEASPKLVFDLAGGKKWQAALTSIGVDPLALSASAGRA